MRTKTSRFGWVFGVLGAWASYAGVVIAPGCGATDTNNGGTDSNTHWLEPCERDSECGGLTCVCGVCTEPCETDDACSKLDGASCALANTCEGPREESSCVVGCRRDAECGDLGSSFICDDGQCVHRSIAHTPGSGGQGAEAGGEAGAPFGGGEGGTSAGAAGAPSPGGSGANAGSAGAPSGGRTTGTGGSAGSGAISGAGAPSTGGSGPTGPCAPMDVQPSALNLPCEAAPPTYYWNGHLCTPLNGCACSGEDCDEVYPTMAACDESYRACYTDLGITGACESDDDCKLTHRGCCASCGEQSFENLAATNEAEEELWHYCPAAPLCPDCVQGGPTPEAAARCEAGRCTVASICADLDEADCEAEELCTPLTAYASSDAREVYAGCVYSGPGSPACNPVESCGIKNDPLADVECLFFPSSCQPRNYSKLDCASTVCSP